MPGDVARVGQRTAPDAPVRPFDALVVGASAGGVEALSVLLSALPADSSLSVFVVIHLPRHQPSLLAEIFARHCALPVREAEDKEPVAPGTVYFAPPDYHLLLDRGPRLALSVDDLVHYSRPAIDVLFESAADVYREKLMGMVLTGGNQDGAAGLAAVHLAGGQAVVQDPATAQTPLMPEAARQRVVAARVLSLNQIAALLRRLNHRGE